MRRFWPVLRRVAGVVLVLAVAAAVVLAMRGQDWSEALAFAGGAGLPLIGLAALVNLVGLALGMLAWRSLADGTGAPVPLAQAAKVFFTGLLVKYLPGRLWTLAVNIKMGNDLGVGTGRMAAVYVLNIVVMITTGMLVGLIAAPSAFGAHTGWVALAAVPALLLWVRPGLVDRSLAVLRRLRRRAGEPLRCEPGAVRSSLAFQTVSWFVTGHHLWLLAIAAGADPAGSYLLCVGVFGLALVIGALVVIVPDGLGVREGVLTVSLALVLPLPLAAAVAVTSRAVATVGELAAALAVYVWARRSATKEHVPAR